MENYIDEPFNQNFCDHLDHHLSRTYINSESKNIKHFLKNIQLFGCHGVNDAEIKTGHIFEIDIEAYVDLETAKLLQKEVSDGIIAIGFSENALNVFRK